MPIYTFSCLRHGEFDVILPMKELTQSMPCPSCGSESKRAIVLGHGGVIRTGDAVPWVRDVAKILTDAPDSDHPNPNINTIQDLRQYYETHPNIRPKESHPAFPSSYGDAIDAAHTDKAQKQRDRSRKGNELLRKMRRLEINS